MKTLTYNTEKEIRIGIIIAVIISAVFTTFKVRELQLSNPNSNEAMRANRIEMTSSSFASMPLADAKLVEEPVQAAQATTASNVAPENELAVQMKTWMNDKAYWNEEQAENEEALTHYMTNCLKNGTYFSDEALDEVPIDNEKELTHTMISSLKSGSYFSDESFNEVPTENKTELSGQLKFALASGNFWNGEYK